MKTGILAAAVLLPACLVQGQVTITSADFFNSIGQYYKTYNGNQPSIDVTGILGSASSVAQTWDFSNKGPSNVVYNTSYLAPADSGVAGDFPIATVAERQMNESMMRTNSWMFLKFTAEGRLNCGFYEVSSELTQKGMFNPPIADFPATINFQTTWTVSTVFDYSMSYDGFTFPVTLNYSGSATVDAYGTIILPKLGELPCLRVNELDQQEYYADLEDSGTPSLLYTTYTRIYYFLSPGLGIVAEIHSQDSTAGAPANDFTSAVQFSRMFEFSRGTSTLPAAVKDLGITISGPTAFLTWSPSANTVSYRVEASSNPGDTNSWQSLGTTTKDYFLDANTSSAAARFYRVVSLAE